MSYKEMTNKILIIFVCVSSSTAWTFPVFNQYTGSLTLYYGNILNIVIIVIW